MITPAISVLSAIEGLEVVSPAFKTYVIPLTLAVLFCLFAVQKRGTAGIGRFGPITLVWFGAISVLGIAHIMHNPEILEGDQSLLCGSVHPARPLHRLHHPWCGGVVRDGRRSALCRPGTLRQEADPPGLVRHRDAGVTLNYFGQGALLLKTPEAVKNPFYLMAPEWVILPLVALATMATVIASQAMITGAFSVTKQAVQLGYLPRLQMRHTSVRETGQIYVPFINWGLFVAIVLAVVMFRSSSNLAAAYGIAVTSDMLITTILTFFVIRYGWRYPLWLCISATSVFFLVDFTFWSSNLLKLEQGGWFPVLIGAAMFTLMMTWKKGPGAAEREAQGRFDRPQEFPGSRVRQPADPGRGHCGFPHRRARHGPQCDAAQPQAQQGAARAKPVRHRAQPRGALDRHEQAGRDRAAGPQLLAGHPARHGFKNDPDVPRALELIRGRGCEVEHMKTSYFLSRDTVVPSIGRASRRGAKNCSRRCTTTPAGPPTS